jgi:pyridinium-3,5-bisthiocarboxylic acid mononucleotide nickel chelatase
MARYHLDCASGIAGDMFLGACLDLGMPLDVVAAAVASLGLRGVTVEQRKASRGGFTGTRFRVLIDGAPIEGPDPDEVAGPAQHAPAHGENGHAHEHPHEPGHSHSHSHPHAHEHSHSHSHSHPHEHDPAHSHSHGHSHDHEVAHDHGHSHDQAAAHTHDHGHSLAPGHPHGPHQHGTGHSHGVADAHDPRGQRDLAQIRTLLATSGLTPAVRERALRLFARLGEAEAKAHGMPIERVHFHEVGAVDSIVDLVGAAAAMEHLAPERLTCGTVNVGGGRVWTAHGELPVPAPATAELLHGVPIHGGPGGELTTPTGAVLLAELVDAYVDLPPLVLEAAGYGLGRKDLPTQPNALRLLRGHAAAEQAWGAAGVGVGVAPGMPVVAVVECEVDDLAGEAFGYLMERLLAAGALDVYFTPVVMKKSRPGTLVSLLCRPPQVAELAGILLVESGSLGCRYHLAARFEAERDSLEVETAFGRVRVKRGRLGGRPLALAPEYEDCRRLALAAGVPWREIYRAALAAAPPA